MVTSAVRKGARMNEIHERDSVDYLMQQAVAVFTGVTVKIGFLGKVGREGRGRVEGKIQKYKRW